jgi:hypothetical protein
MLQKIPYELRALALEEIYALRDLATASERERLNYWAMRPGDAERCILGQMTGRVPNLRCLNIVANIRVPFTNYMELGKKYDNQTRLAFDIYCRLPWAENYKIIQFLQGIRQDLTVDDL